MKKLLTILAILTALPMFRATAQFIPDETLNYQVMFKWGIITKDAGNITLTATPIDNDYFRATLTGRSAEWSDKFYTVRDTVEGTIMRNTLEPVYYEKIAHESGQFRRNVIVYDRSNPEEVTGASSLWRRTKEQGPIVQSHVSLTGTGLTLDMLSAFYYMRFIDYEAMRPGQTVVCDLFSADEGREVLTITYEGLVDNLLVGGNQYNCYLVKFSFSSREGDRSANDIHAWVARDDNRIPVMLLGELPVGVIRCIYTP